jgi:hypothetical protein
LSRNLTARIVAVLIAAIGIWVVSGCQSEPPAPIQGDVQKADPNATTAKPGGGQNVDVNK